jgi:hypothetical protein
MATAWFDGDNLEINIPSGLLQTIDVQIELYSDWKEWVKLADNARFPQAFDTTGGDPLGGGQIISPYFFIRNDLGWRLASNAADSTINYLGNLFARIASIDFEDFALGGAHSWKYVISPQSLTTAGGGGGLTAQQTRDAMELETTSGQASVDTKLNNNFAVSAAAL